MTQGDGSLIPLEQQHRQEQSVNDFCVLAFYQFFAKPPQQHASDDDTMMILSTSIAAEQEERQWRDELETKFRSYHTFGMIRISIHEGMNGTICFPTPHLQPIATFLRQQQQQHHVNHRRSNDAALSQEQEENFDISSNSNFTSSSSSSSSLKIRISYSPTPTFHRLSIRIKEEIVTMGPIPHHWISSSSPSSSSSSSSANSNIDQTTTTTSTSLIRPYRCMNGPSTTTTTNNNAGIYVSAAGPEWDELLLDPHCFVIDTRNQYEIQMGTFRNAISPQTNEFIEFPQWLHTTLLQQQQQQLGQLSQSPRYNKIAMFCTGGIRCEKATTLCIQMLQQQLQQQQQSDDKSNNVPTSIPPVYHLEGGILAYLDNHPNPQAPTSTPTDDIASTEAASTTPLPSITTTTTEHGTDEQQRATTNATTAASTCRSSSSPFQYGNNFLGECFVFDQRVAVMYGLQPTQQYISCHACRRPVHVTNDTKDTTKYQVGICCPFCYDNNGVHHESHDVTSNTDDAIVTTAAATTTTKKQRFVERQKQMELAQHRQLRQPHIYDSKYGTTTGTTTSSKVTM